MAGSHRATHRAPRARSGSVSRRALALAVVVALIPAAWFTLQRTFGDEDPKRPTSRGTQKPIPSVGTTPPSSPATTPPTTPAATPLPPVAPDSPRRLTSGSVLDTGFDESVEPDGDSFVARSTSEVSRWGSRGEPGSPGTDTVYVVGRTSGAFANLDDLKAGSTVSLRTDNGTLTYRVSAVTTVAERGFARSPVVTAKVPGRLVLIGTGGSGYRVVTAQLSAAETS
ncbi:MAG: class F sortase [Nocardioidaceae bacterium]|nr:class F sortase [Nocardioidaceae bacterium]